MWDFFVQYFSVFRVIVATRKNFFLKNKQKRPTDWSYLAGQSTRKTGISFFLFFFPFFFVCGLTEAFSPSILYFFPQFVSVTGGLKVLHSIYLNCFIFVFKLSIVLFLFFSLIMVKS